ncbi:MMPL family transporter [Streptomyces sp. NPDC090106]|uniref:MMPL family transporter n=1 Tax=Streptomyces sp. NPDC090106 TaxID=3365946 RepID=UPI003810F597
MGTVLAVGQSSAFLLGGLFLVGLLVVATGLLLARTRSTAPPHHERPAPSVPPLRTESPKDPYMPVSVGIRMEPPVPNAPKRAGFLHRTGRWSARHPWLVVAGWLLVLLAAVAGNRAFGGVYEDDFSLPGTSAQTGADLLDRHGGDASKGVSAKIVVKAESGPLASHRDAVDTAVDRLGELPDVISVTSPLDAPGADSASAAAVSEDGTTGYLTVQFDENPATFDPVYLDQVDDAVAELRADRVEVEYADPLGKLAADKGTDRASELIGLATAVVVLLIGFGSVAAAGFPLLTAVIGLLAGLSGLGMLAALFTFGAASPTLASMMGLGVGLDYSLFLVTRHRKLLHTTSDPAESIGRTVATSGRAVLVAALTVAMALAGLYASGILFIGMLGTAAGVTVTVGALAALTLTPALLGLAGRRIDRWYVRTPVDEPDDTGDIWHRWAVLVGRRSWTFLALGMLVLGVLSIPLASIRLGHVDAGASPAAATERKAYDLLSAGFGPGTNGQFTVVTTLDKDGPVTDAARTEVANALHTALADTPGVRTVSTPRPSPDGALLITTVTPDSGPQDAATSDLLHRLDDDVLQQAGAPHHATSYVTGTTAAQLEFRDMVSDRLPVIIAVVAVAAFLLLLIVFRSVLIAVKAALLNLLSIAAAYGVVVAVFQWGWGSSWLGVDETVPIEAYVPMMMFAIVFGLSMDYEVFLLSRIRETWLETKDNQLSVATGLSATARVITCAALIMTSVFLAFLLSSNVVIKMMALGLGVSVVLDATVVRLILVPAGMNLLGRANWWLPRGLDRLLPHLDPEGHTPAPAAATVEREEARP